MNISWTKLKINNKQTIFSIDIKHFVIEKSNTSTSIILNLYSKTFFSIVSLQQSESIYLNKFLNMLKLFKNRPGF